MHQNKNQNQHIPVLLNAVLDSLAPKPGETYLDVTAGRGGHAAAILAVTKGPAVLIDRDQEAVDYLKAHYQTHLVNVWHQDFLAASSKLNERGERFDMILADLGVSSPHLNKASRGFSWQASGPLDMRMDQRQALTAGDIVNSYSEQQLAEVIRQYGEEPRSTAIARAIIRRRPVANTTELAEIITTVVRRHGQKIHPATRSFQALRLAVNSELEQLKVALPIWIDLLQPDGRLAVISFHSLEDRLVKQAFADASIGYEATIKLQTKKPISADRQEIVHNPRARSAKLRSAVKINNDLPLNRADKQRRGLDADSGKKHLSRL